MKKPCLKCGLPTEDTHCPAHAPLPYYPRNSKGRKPKGTTTERGYGTEHRNARKQLATQLPTPCAYGCGRILTEDTKWVAAHVVDGDPTYGWVASCPQCNETAKRAAIAKRKEVQAIRRMQEQMCTLNPAPAPEAPVHPPTPRASS